MNLSRGFEPVFFSTDRPPLDRLFPTLSLSLSAEHAGENRAGDGLHVSKVKRAAMGRPVRKNRAKFVQGR